MRIVSLSLVVLMGAVVGCGSPGGRAGDGRTLLSRGDYAGAERAADDALARAPDDRAAWHLKLDAVARQGEHARAVELYRQWHQRRRHYDEDAIRLIARGTLRAAATDAAASLRARAVGAMRRAGRGFDDALEARLGDVDPVVRAAAAAARYRHSERARRLARQLAVGSEPRARALALEAISAAGGARALLEDALADADPAVRRAAVRGLAAFGDADDTPRLIEVATRDGDGTVRAEALAAMTMGSRGGIFAAGDAALADDYLGSRLAAVAILSRSGQPGLARLRQLAESNDAYVALRAVVALRKAGVDVHTDAVERALGHRLWSVRAAGLNAVAEVAPRAVALDLIGRALVDEREEVRLAAARVLARLGEHGRAAQTFYSALESPRDPPRLQAAIALYRMGDDGGLKALATLLESPQPATRAAAAALYAQTEHITLPLVGALADPDPGVRLAAAETLLRY